MGSLISVYIPGYDPAHIMNYSSWWFLTFRGNFVNILFCITCFPESNFLWFFFSKGLIHFLKSFFDLLISKFHKCISYFFVGGSDSCLWMSVNTLFNYFRFWLLNWGKGSCLRSSVNFLPSFYTDFDISFRIFVCDLEYLPSSGNQG